MLNTVKIILKCLGGKFALTLHISLFRFFSYSKSVKKNEEASKFFIDVLTSVEITPSPQFFQLVCQRKGENESKNCKRGFRDIFLQLEEAELC